MADFTHASLKRAVCTALDATMQCVGVSQKGFFTNIGATDYDSTDASHTHSTVLARTGCGDWSGFSFVFLP